MNQSNRELLDRELDTVKELLESKGDNPKIAFIVIAVNEAGFSYISDARISDDFLIQICELLIKNKKN